MQFLFVTLFLIVAGVGALFTLKDNDFLLITTFAVVIVGFIFGVSRIAAEKK
jgi:hypothetical protein